MTLVERLLKLLCAFPLVLQQHVQDARPGGSTLLSEYLTPGDRAALSSVDNQPVYLLGKLARQLRSIPDSASFGSAERMMAQRHVEDLCSCVGACERLVQTPVPLTSVRHSE